MHEETSTRFFDWVDHIVLPASHAPKPVLEALGFVPDTNGEAREGLTLYWHLHGEFPRILIDPKATNSSVAIAVESVDAFREAFGIESTSSPNDHCSSYRTLSVNEGTNKFSIVERHGYRDFVPQENCDSKTLQRAKEMWTKRKRDSYSPEEARDVMRDTLALARELEGMVGAARAADIVLAVERDRWMERNAAGRWQKERLDRLGLGWGGIRDHHTFREDRENFPALIQIFLALGFKKREPYSPPGQQHWAAQIMEHPVTGDVLFLDVDFFPEDDGIDFASVPLPPRGKFWTVGRWCALHDSSIRGAGMHHLECQFDFEKLKTDLESAGKTLMDKFSNLPHLMQAFTRGEEWPVDSRRLEHARSIGAISDQTYKEIKAKRTSIGSHLENLERNDGFKGFNQEGVGEILHAVDPQRVAVQQDIATTLSIES